MTRKRRVPMAEKKRVVAGGNPVMSGTRKVAPNIATTCCAPIPMVRGQLSRSPGATTSPGPTRTPSPCTVQIAMVNPSPRWIPPRRLPPVDRAPGAFPHGILDRVSDDQWQAPGRETSAGRTPPAAPDGPAPHPPPPARYAPAPGPAAPGHNPYATPAPEAAPAPGSWVHAFGATEEHRAQVLGGTGYTTPAYRNDSVAVTAMVLGILGVVLPGVCLLAIAFGHAA